MVSTYQRKGPSGPFIVVSAIAVVMSCVLVWGLSFQWLQDSQEANQNSTLSAESTSRATPPTSVFSLNAPTEVPDCQSFEVAVNAATIRICPSEQCERRDIREFEDPVCVYSRAEPSEQYPLADEWYIIDINPDGAFRDLAYMHQSVLRPINPTPRPSKTFTPLPTVTLTPSPTFEPQTFPSSTPTPSPTLPFTPTLAQVEF
jgi:hypothetical protein